MKIYLAGITKAFIDDMKLYLAESGGMWHSYFKGENFVNAYILQSFYYADEFTEQYIIPNAKKFMLDSGAFTFMQNSKHHLDWDEYVERYANFINKNNVDQFFELDIDSVIGYDKVKQYRDKLEKLTGKQCIPVMNLKECVRNILMLH